MATTPRQLRALSDAELDRYLAQLDGWLCLDLIEIEDAAAEAARRGRPVAVSAAAEELLLLRAADRQQVAA